MFSTWAPPVPKWRPPLWKGPANDNLSHANLSANPPRANLCRANLCRAVRKFLQMLGFTDAEMEVLTALAAALPPPSRDGFLRLVASKLSAYPPETRGPGLVHRVATEAQRGFLNVAVGSRGKYRL